MVRLFSQFTFESHAEQYASDLEIASQETPSELGRQIGVVWRVVRVFNDTSGSPGCFWIGLVLATCILGRRPSAYHQLMSIFCGFRMDREHRRPRGTSH